MMWRLASSRRANSIKDIRKQEEEEGIQGTREQLGRDKGMVRRSRIIPTSMHNQVV